MTFELPPPILPQFQAGQVTANAEAYLHAVCGAQYGDLEFDVGKSIRWTQWFTDDVYITDVNLGTQRYWVVNWTLTYPMAFHGVTSTNYFAAPAKFRQIQWNAALAERGLQFDDDDWVIFIDAHEGMCIDTRDPQPTNHDVEPFKSYLYREIQRCIDASTDRATFPLYAFVRHDDIIKAHYDSPAFEDGTLGYTTATADMGTPYYIAHQGLTRLWKVSTLRDPSFDWTLLDVPTAPDTGRNVAIVSYGYAHWNLQDIEPPQTEVPPLTEANDDGWRMRKLISMVRPIAGLPYESATAAVRPSLEYDHSSDPAFRAYFNLVPPTAESTTHLWWVNFDIPNTVPPYPMAIISVSGTHDVLSEVGDNISAQTMRDTWVPQEELDVGLAAGSAPFTWVTDHWVMSGSWPPAEDPGIPGPWAAADQFTPDPEEAQPVTPDPSLAGLLVPLYDNVIRINMRDGVWYEGGELGNLPLTWDEDEQKWVPRDMPPEDWHQTDTWVASPV